jgi:hypothetical protein
MFQQAKQALMRKLLEKQLAALPKEQRDLFEKLMNEHPELLMQIAQDLQAEMKTGKSQTEAMQAVAIKHQDELKKIVGTL